MELLQILYQELIDEIHPERTWLFLYPTTTLRIPIFFTYWQFMMAQINFLASLNTLQIV